MRPPLSLSSPANLFWKGRIDGFGKRAAGASVSPSWRFAFCTFDTFQKHRNIPLYWKVSQFIEHPGRISVSLRRQNLAHERADFSFPRFSISIPFRKWGCVFSLPGSGQYLASARVAFSPFSFLFPMPSREKYYPLPGRSSKFSARPGRLFRFSHFHFR